MAFCTSCGATVKGAFCQNCGTPLSAASAQPPAAPPMPPPMPMSGPAPMPPPMTQARKTSPIVWILVILLGLFALGIVGVVGTGLFVAHKVRQVGIDPDLWRRNPGLAVGKIIAATNPDVEVLGTDDATGRIRLRDKRTGKVTSMTFDDVRNGRFSMTAEDDNGKTATLQFGGGPARLPDWVPNYPGSSPQMTISANSADTNGGNFSFTTPDAPSKVLHFYQDKAKELGLKVSLAAITETGGTMAAGDDASHRSLTVVVGGGNQTGVNVTYGVGR